MDRPAPVALVVLTSRGVEVASWPLDGDRVDLALIDALARLRLRARRLGYTLELRDACPALVDLLDLLGLPCVLASPSIEVLGQPEGGEEVGVEEAVVTDDPPV